MATVSFTKLELKKKSEVKHISINGQDIEVKQYLPINEKLKLIENIISNSADENNFANPVKLEVIESIEMISAYTNITFTPKQKEDYAKLYDLLEENDIILQIVEAIPEHEYSALVEWINATVKSVYDYRNSVLGILEQVSTDYSHTLLASEEIKNNIANPDNLALLKSILELDNLGLK